RPARPAVASDPSLVRSQVRPRGPEMAKRHRPPWWTRPQHWACAPEAASAASGRDDLERDVDGISRYRQALAASTDRDSGEHAARSGVDPGCEAAAHRVDRHAHPLDRRSAIPVVREVEGVADGSAQRVPMDRAAGRDRDTRRRDRRTGVEVTCEVLERAYVRPLLGPDVDVRG